MATQPQPDPVRRRALTAEDKEYILFYFDNNLLARADYPSRGNAVVWCLAEDLGVSRSTIWNVIRRRKDLQ
jgi:hypothetical protein